MEREAGSAHAGSESQGAHVGQLSPGGHAGEDAQGVAEIHRPHRRDAGRSAEAHGLRLRDERGGSCGADHDVRRADGDSGGGLGRRQTQRRRQRARLQIHWQRSRDGRGVETFSRDGDGRVMGARRGGEPRDVERDAGERPRAGALRHSERAGEGVPTARADELRQRGDQRRGHPASRPDERPLARGIAEQGARQLHAGGDVGRGPRREDEPRRRRRDELRRRADAQRGTRDRLRRAAGEAAVASHREDRARTARSHRCARAAGVGGSRRRSERGGRGAGAGLSLSAARLRARRGGETLR